MSSIRMQEWLMCLLLVPVAWAMMKMSMEDACSKVKTIERVPSSASGRWYLVAAKKRDMMDKANIQSRMPQCGGFNSAAPCSCSGLDVSSSLTEPFIPEYNVTTFSYNMTSGKYDSMSFMMKLADDKSNLATFTAEERGGAGSKSVITGLATDDHQTFMLLYICNDSGEQMDVWFLSKSAMPSESTLDEVNKALETNNMTMAQLSMVTQDDCVYPPPPDGSTMTSRANKFKVF